MPATEPRTRRDAVERLYVYWLASTLLLALLLITSVILTRGQLTRQESSLRDALSVAATANTRADMLEQRLQHLEHFVRDIAISPGVRPPARPDEEHRDETAAAPPDAPANGTAEERPPAPPAPAESDLLAALAAVAGDAPETPADILDPQGANELVRAAEPLLARADWSAATIARLATVAQLIGRERAARSFAQRALAAGHPLVEYTAARIRALLARGQVNEAFTTTMQLVERADGQPVVDALLAATLHVYGEPAAADEVLVGLAPVVSELGLYDRLLVGRVAVGLERWPMLDAALGDTAIEEGPLAHEHSFLTAVSLVRRDRTVEALAMFDWLREGAPAGSTTDPVWPWPRPTRYEIELWRGITLAAARQHDAARTALEEVVRLDPGRAEGHFQLGQLEARVAQPEIARGHLRNALACDARYAPAWEVLAVLDIAEGHVATGLEHLQQALQINPRRAHSHFLAAIAYAKVTRPEPAIDALREALRLAPEYLAEARQTEVLTRLITPADMAALLEEEPYEAPEVPMEPETNEARQPVE